MTTAPFSLRLDRNLKKALTDEARRQDRSASYLASRAIAEYLQARARERALLKERLREAGEGRFVSEERVLEWVDSWFTDGELPPPEPDIAG